jgi:hypothetical protein
VTTRLHFIFDGGPDDEERTLREVADGRNNQLTFGHLAKWVPVSKPKNIWALEVDVLDLDRPPIVALCAARDRDSFTDAVLQFNDLGRVVLRREVPLTYTLRQDAETIRREEQLQFQRIAIADFLFVVNERLGTGHADEILAMKAEIAYAEKLGKRVVYLRYDDDVDWSTDE